MVIFSSLTFAGHVSGVEAECEPRWRVWLVTSCLARCCARSPQLRGGPRPRHATNGQLAALPLQSSVASACSEVSDTADAATLASSRSFHTLTRPGPGPGYRAQLQSRSTDNLLEEIKSKWPP